MIVPEVVVFSFLEIAEESANIVLFDISKDILAESFQKP